MVTVHSIEALLHPSLQCSCNADRAFNTGSLAPQLADSRTVAMLGRKRRTLFKMEKTVRVMKIITKLINSLLIGFTTRNQNVTVASWVLVRH